MCSRLWQAATASWKTGWNVLLLFVGVMCIARFILKHESMFTLDHKGNVVFLARWFHLTAFTRTLSHVDVGVGSSQRQESLEWSQWSFWSGQQGNISCAVVSVWACGWKALSISICFWIVSFIGRAPWFGLPGWRCEVFSVKADRSYRTDSYAARSCVFKCVCV